MRVFAVYLLLSFSSKADFIFKECPEYVDECLTINNKLVSKGQLSKILKTSSDLIPDEYKGLLTEENLGKLNNRGVIKLGDLKSIDIAKKAKEAIEAIREAGNVEDVNCHKDGTENNENNENTIILNTQTLEEEVLPYLKYSKQWSDIDDAKKEAIVAHIASLQSNFSPEIDTSVMMSNLKDGGNGFGSNYIVQVLVEYIDASLLMNRKELGDIVNPILREINPEMSTYFKQKYGLLDKYGEDDIDYIKLENLDKFNSAKDIVLNDIREQDDLRKDNEYAGKKTVSLHSYMSAIGKGRNGLEYDAILRGENRSIGLLYGKDSMPIFYNSKIGLHSRIPNRQAQYGLGGEVYEHLIHPILSTAAGKALDKYSKFSCEVTCGLKAGGTALSGLALTAVAIRTVNPAQGQQGVHMTISAIGGLISGVGVYGSCVQNDCVKKGKLDMATSENKALKAELDFISKDKKHKKAKDDLATANDNVNKIDGLITKQEDIVKNTESEKEKIKAQKRLDELNEEKERVQSALKAAQDEEEKARKDAEAARLEAERLRKEADKIKKDNGDADGTTYPINPSIAAALDDSGGITTEAVVCIQTDCTLVRPGRDTNINGYSVNLSGVTLEIAKKEHLCEKGVCKKEDVIDPFKATGKKPGAMGEDLTNPGRPGLKSN